MRLQQIELMRKAVEEAEKPRRVVWQDYGHLGLTPITEMGPSLLRPSQISDLNKAPVPPATLFQQLQTEMESALLAANERLMKVAKTAENEFPYTSFARDKSNRAVLRSIHFWLGEFQSWVEANRSNLGDRFHADYLSELRKLSALAIRTSYWVLGLAFKMAQKADFNRSSSDEKYEEAAYDLVATLAEEIRAGDLRYEPGLELRAPGGWFSTLFFRRAREQFDKRKTSGGLRDVARDAVIDSVFDNLIEREDAQDRERQLRRCRLFLSELSRIERYVFLGQIWEHMSFQEIADSLKLPKSRIWRIHKRVLKRARTFVLGNVGLEDTLAK